MKCRLTSVQRSALERISGDSVGPAGVRSTTARALLALGLVECKTGRVPWEVSRGPLAITPAGRAVLSAYRSQPKESPMRADHVKVGDKVLNAGHYGHVARVNPTPVSVAITFRWHDGTETVHRLPPYFQVPFDFVAGRAYGTVQMGARLLAWADGHDAVRGVGTAWAEGRPVSDEQLLEALAILNDHGTPNDPDDRVELEAVRQYVRDRLADASK